MTRPVFYGRSGIVGMKPSGSLGTGSGSDLSGIVNWELCWELGTSAGVWFDFMFGSIPGYATPEFLLLEARQCWGLNSGFSYE